jgi:hypothetical protein
MLWPMFLYSYADTRNDACTGVALTGVALTGVALTGVGVAGCRRWCHRCRRTLPVMLLVPVPSVFVDTACARTIKRRWRQVLAVLYRRLDRHNSAGSMYVRRRRAAAIAAQVESRGGLRGRTKAAYMTGPVSKTCWGRNTRDAGGGEAGAVQTYCSRCSQKRWI